MHCRTNTRNIEKDLQGWIASVDTFTEDLARTKQNLTSKETEIVSVEEAMKRFKEQVARKEGILNEEIQLFKDKIDNLKSEEQANIEKLMEDLRIVEEELKKLKVESESEKVKGLEFLRKVSEKLVAYIDECTGYRDTAAKAVADALKHRVEMIVKYQSDVEAK